MRILLCRAAIERPGAAIEAMGIADRFALFSGIVTAALLGGCSVFGEPPREDVAWTASPDGRVHAILGETNGGATTSFGYVVELHPAGHDEEAPVLAASLYGAVRSACAYGVDLHWLDASTLAVEFYTARQIKAATSVVVGGRPIRIVVQPGRVNPAAPCGGMAYARHG